jgi:LmbE family N-acetylglucosaminyl deacetylase
MNPDHMAIGRATTDACRAAGDPAFEVAESGEPYAPRWLVYVFAPRAMLKRFGGKQGREVAGKQIAPQFAMPIDAGIKIRGWRIHQTQANYLRKTWGLPPWILYRLYDKEHFAVIENPSAKLSSATR